ncbi:hypothetical protein B7P34_29445 [Streptosporangium nondiastaticum]|uniref:Uncharacterized protein n=2 Tax=Actinomycetes TaxID=1760 RepID=A0A9X7JK19_9ACTN|nr:hypothetical protein [Streptosporangium nondiastaticum]PSJ25188.1 hypothetical protein B7P34_29445 [Streptosporangium nondiastaticum]
MNDTQHERWVWEYDPDRENVVGGLPGAVVAQVEKIADDLVSLCNMGIDVTELGEGGPRGRPGGVRRMQLSPDGWVQVLPAPRLRMLAVVQVTPPFQHL